MSVSSRSWAGTHWMSGKGGADGAEGEQVRALAGWLACQWLAGKPGGW